MTAHVTAVQPGSNLSVSYYRGQTVIHDV